ncbi:hypothetical protein CEW92_04990 [Bacillaceae bacterium SAS-127]|nr:hypothetical protein CEW92_04990 [Bacillaceae bacterium SAS-127]
MTNQMTLSPEYMKQFSCIGPACEDSCCKGWRVTIDKETYKKYRKVKDEPWRERFEKSIKRNKDSAGFNDFGYVQLNEEAACPMLDRGGLCSIHKDFGHDLLSYTCQVYPRNYSQYNEIIEESLTLSCPEVARLALLNPEKIEFSLEAKDLFNKFSVGKKVLSATMGNKDHRKYFFEIRSLVIELLQERKFNLAERLLLVGLYVKHINEKLSNTSFEEITDRFLGMIQDVSEVKQMVQQLPKRTELQLSMLTAILKLRLSGGVSSERYVQCLAEVEKGLLFNESNISKEKQIKAYEEAYESIVAPFMKQHEYVFENYLVHLAFTNAFSSDKDLFNDYIQLVLHYALVKMHVVGLAAYHGELTMDVVLKLIQSLSKVVDHHPNFLQKTNEMLKENHLNTVAHMVILIKD